MSSLPKLRLSEFSDSDTYFPHKFDDIFSFSSGKNIKQNESSPEFSTPCVRYGELYHMYGEVITRTINNTNLEHSELTFSAGNEILLPSAGEDPLDIGSASALTLEGVAIGRTINVLRPKGTIDYSHIYVSYYINEKLRKRISQLARGASISNVYNSDLKTLKACLPSFSEQQKVASFLSKVDEKITLLTEKKSKLTEYKKGVMQQLFNGKWEEQDGQLTFIPPTLRFKADDGSEFPDWEEKRLGKVIVKYSETSIFNNQHTVLTSSNRGLIKQTDYFGTNRITEKDNTGFNVIPEGYLTYRSRSDTRTFTFNLNRTGEKGIISTYYPVFSTKECSNGFIEHYLNHFKYHIGKFSVGTSQTVLSLNELMRIKLSLPCNEEQTKIMNFLSAIDKKIDVANSEVEKAKEWKKGLLQQMFV